MPALVTADKLTGFAGSPFAENVVNSAGESVRSRAGWHIAPEVSETLVVESEGGQFLFLPTLRISDITEIRDITAESSIVTPRILDDWRFSSTPGVLFRAGRWPAGLLEVDLTHGFTECPADLLPAVAEAARTSEAGGRVAQESLGSRSISFDRRVGPIDPVSRYTVGSTP